MSFCGYQDQTNLSADLVLAFLSSFSTNMIPALFKELWNYCRGKSDDEINQIFSSH